MLAKDLLGAMGPLATVAVFFAVTRERNVARRWIPWAGVLLFLAIAVPWYAVVEARNPGFLWYTVVDNHVLNLARHRVFPDEDVPAVRAGVPRRDGDRVLALVPGAAVGGLAALRGPWPTAESRAWLLLALWTAGSLAVFTLSPFKLPHYGLPAFPALALLVAKLWDEVLDGVPGAPSPRTLLVPPLLLFAAAAAAAFLAWKGYLALPADALPSADVATRNVAARGPDLPFMSREQLAPLFRSLAVVFGVGALAVAARARAAPADHRAGRAPGRHARLPPVLRGGLRALRPQPVGADPERRGGPARRARGRARPRGRAGEQRLVAPHPRPARRAPEPVR